MRYYLYTIHYYISNTTKSNTTMRGMVQANNLNEAMDKVIEWWNKTYQTLKLDYINIHNLVEVNGLYSETKESIYQGFKYNT